MKNSMEIIFISKRRNFLYNLRLPLSIIFIILSFFIAITISTLIIFIHTTRKTFGKMHIGKIEREHSYLLERLDSLNLVLKNAQGHLGKQIAQDNLERTFWQMAYIHPDIWSMGIGGKEYEKPDEIKTHRTDRLLNEIYQSIDILKGKQYLRQTSLKEIQGQIDKNLELWARIPSISPLPGHNICSGFGYRVDPIDKRVRMHWGVDIGAPRGTKIYASADGIVSNTGWISGYGWTVEVDHGFGFKTCYAHCNRILVKEGALVKRGQAIATVGSTGRSISSHLHYEVRVSGVKVNPIKYINTSSVIFD